MAVYNNHCTITGSNGTAVLAKLASLARLASLAASLRAMHNYLHLT